MIENTKRIGYSVGFKYFVVVATIAGMVLSVFAGFSYIEDGELYHLVVLVIPFFLFCAMGLWYAFKFKLIITNDYIEQEGLLRPTKLYFDRVSVIYLYGGSMALKGQGGKINITSDLQDQKKVMNHLLQVLKGRPNVEMKGYNRAIAAAVNKDS